MIVQGLLDFISQWLAGLIGLLPPLPAPVGTILGWIHGAGSYLSGLLSSLGILVPWSLLASVMAVWVGLVGFWLVMLLVRLVLWVVGR